ncbi:MAG: prephenate dehydratase [archaeon]
MNISFLGPETTFTHIAAISHFGEKNSFAPKKSIAEVFESVEKNETDFGVVPVENSTEGSVAHTLDSFFESKLKITAEIVIPINQCLIGNTKKSKISKIFSHSQAIGQCRKYIAKNFPDAEILECASTASAAMLALKEKNSAAIASILAAKKFGLKVIEEKINDEYNNQTRFFVIGKKESKAGNKNKTTILFSTKNVPGALYKVLGIFSKYNINMTKIESRPSKKKTWEVVFFIDFEGHKEDEKIKKALLELHEYCDFLNVLGSYPTKTGIID